MPNVDFVIGAKNNASAPMAAAANSLKRLESVATTASSALNRIGDRASVSFRSLMKIAIPLSAARIALKGFRAAFHAAQASVELFAKNQAGTTKATTMQAAFESAGSALERLGTTVGEILAPALTMGADAITWLADKANEVLQPAIQSIMEWTVKAFTIVEVVFKNFGQVVELAISSALLQFETMKNVVVDVFTRVLPEYFLYFGQLVATIFQNAFNAALATLQNFGQKMTDGILAIFEFIRGGMQGGLSQLAADIATAISGSLLEGFNSESLPNLPQLMQRQLSEREVELQNKVAGIASGLATQFNEKFQARMEAFGAKAKQQKVEGTIVQAVEARLLTRGPGSKTQDFAEQTAKNTKKIADDSEEAAAQRAAIESEQRLMREAFERQDTLRIEAPPA